MTDTTDLRVLHQKIDHLTTLLEEQHRQREEAKEFQRELTPILNQMVRLSIEELSDVGGEFESEDILYLLKYILRNTRSFIGLLDRLEATVTMLDELSILVKPMFHHTVETLDDMEHQGYFTFARHGNAILKRIVTEFGEDDLEALGDNVVTILSTVRNMTQPDIMGLVNRAVDTMRYDDLDDENISTWRLLREIRDPEVRRGMMRLLNMVKSMADVNESPSSN